MSKEFMGAGWTFPVRVSPDRKIVLSRAEEDIREAILIILNTAKGERVMRPDFGCGINELVFEPLNQATFNRVETTVREALLFYEPRIDVISVYVAEAEENADKGKLEVNIEYSVKSTNGRNNLVYDFYLKEG
ncbi:MAG: GPW/gp25 family protein [Deltaproteobacteria bacterium]|nr:GPW/gp25 family protein [Deltaproteobacteria bacterium]MCP5007169.1 GPW/gp25 family protein [Planctomycetota bacterium]